jgi:hypothetical protein
VIDMEENFWGKALKKRGILENTDIHVKIL